MAASFCQRQEGPAADKLVDDLNDVKVDIRTAWNKHNTRYNATV